MKSRNDLGCIRLDQGFRDMKNYRASNRKYTPRLATVLLICSLIVLLSHMAERDNHPFNDVSVGVE